MRWDEDASRRIRPRRSRAGTKWCPDIAALEGTRKGIGSTYTVRHHLDEYRLYDHSISRQRLSLPHCFQINQSVFCTDTPRAERNKQRGNMNPRKIVDSHHMRLQTMCRGELPRTLL